MYSRYVGLGKCSSLKKPTAGGTELVVKIVAMCSDNWALLQKLHSTRKPPPTTTAAALDFTIQGGSGTGS